MFFALFFVIMFVAYLVWARVKCSKAKKYQEACDKWGGTEEFKSSGYSFLSSFLHHEKGIEEYYKPRHTIGHVVFFIICIIFCTSIWIGVNSHSKRECNLYMTASATYQEFADSTKDRIITTEGYNKVLEFNDKVLTERNCQNNWYYRWYHLFRDDWNEVPLVTFK